jgi:putative MATE family efflux protein
VLVSYPGVGLLARPLLVGRRIARFALAAGSSILGGVVHDGALVHRRLVVSGSIDRAILHLGAPAAAAALLQAAFLIVDAFWLGRVGPVALAAASTAGFVMWLAQTIAEGLASGSGSLLAHAVGAGRGEDARRAASAGQSLAVWASLVVVAGGLELSRHVFAFMGTDPEVTRAGLEYLRLIVIGMPAYFMFVWVAAAFRAAGDARTPLRLLALAAAVNVVMDPLLIFGVGPLPRLGVAGAAVATVASWCVAATRGWIELGALGVRPRVLGFLKPPRDCLLALRVGLPLSVEGALFSVIYILLTQQTTGFGTGAVAALGVGHKLEMLNYFVCAGMGAAATTLVGQSLGAQAKRRAARSAWRTLFITCLPVGAVTVLLVVFPELAVTVFSNDAGVIDAGMTYVLLVGMSQVFMAAEVVLMGAFAGTQWTTVPVASEVAVTAARVPIAAWLIHSGLGVEGVWLAISTTTIVKGTVLAILFAFRLRSESRSRTMVSPGQGGNDDRDYSTAVG